MKVFYLRSFLLAFLLLAGANNMNAQNLPVGSPLAEELYRRYQLDNKLDSTISFTIRPLSQAALTKHNVFFADTATVAMGTRTKQGGIDVHWYPATVTQQFTSHHPYGWNDGAMIPARGYETLITGGLFARFKFLSMQLNPEYVYAENKKFNGFAAAGHNPVVYNLYLGFNSRIDQPERFGNGAYSKLFWGQSNVSITVDPVALSLSTENVWWGPGLRNSLLMSNTAPGFAHLSLKLVRPLHTPIGSFEAELIAGKLTGTGIPSILEQGEVNKNYLERPNDWRYLSGLTLNYQPRWVPGFFLGMVRTYSQYHKGMSGFFDYFPVFQAFEKKDYKYTVGKPFYDDRQRDQLISIFARYYSKETRSEIYAEYGRNDHSWDIRDLTVEPEHSRAYILGMRKFFPVRSRDDEFIRAGIELTELARGRTTTIREVQPWYQHTQIRHGYTYEGQVLGAGIGTGSNHQSLDFAWVKGLRSIGLQVERYTHNNDFYYDAFGGTQPGTSTDIRRNWIDLSYMASGSWDFGQLLLSGKMGLIRSLNYEWELHNDPDPNVYWTPGHDVTNFQAQLGMSYRFR